MIEFARSVPCAENEGNDTTFEICEDGLIVTTVSLGMRCELVTCISHECAEELLEALLAALAKETNS